MINKTTFIFKIPNFSSGFSSVLDIAGTNTKFKTSKTSEEADYKALLSDWTVTGQDIKNAIIDYDELIEKVG
mgnify:CR=1 FL=1